jgi:hypothetical protein
MFDMRRYAQIQEHGIKVGGDIVGDVKRFCAVQAYMYCTHNELKDLMGHYYNPYLCNIPDRHEIIQLNDMGTAKDREWLVSILPQLDKFAKLRKEKLTSEINRKSMEAVCP